LRKRAGAFEVHVAVVIQGQGDGLVVHPLQFAAEVGQRLA
jgi:hypothetical protein